MTSINPTVQQYHDAVSRMDPVRVRGRVTQAIGLIIESQGPAASIGEVCSIPRDGNGRTVLAEVVGFRENHLLLMPLGDVQDIAPGSEVVSTRQPLTAGVGEGLLGRVLDGLGNPLDGKPLVHVQEYRRVNASPPNPLLRARITEPLSLGVRAIDGLLTCGKGQRIGIFAGAGVGKSTLLGMMARHTTADVNVIALVGERGREVREFIERDLGAEGLARSALVVATSDQPAVVRLKAAQVATTIAEYFRDQGLDVVLMMDSVTRFAWAQREIGLAIGEPPTTRGYTPSVFAALPRLLERAGTAEHGSITGLYTILVEADDMNEPVADAVRSILDGHIVLSRRLAHQNLYPAVDVLSSVSRLMTELASSDHLRAASAFRDVLATYQEAEDLVNIGAYVTGSNPKIDRALALMDACRAFLRQTPDQRADYTESVTQLQGLMTHG